MKYVLRFQPTGKHRVAPHAGAGIEILSGVTEAKYAQVVAPHAGAGIEIYYPIFADYLPVVAPHAGAGIEI